LRLLARREYSRCELARKLGSKSFGDGEVTAALDQLEASGYLSDLRFAEMVVRTRVGGGFGPLRIRFELREKGVPEHLVEQALTEAAPDWPELARQARGRHFGAAEPVELKDKARQARYLHARGFTSQQVSVALNGAEV